jgi:hypothetical protein
MLFAHHTKSYLGLDIEINDRPFPDGMIDHVLVLMLAVLVVYGCFAILRDLLHWWWPRSKVNGGHSQGA